MGSVSELTAGVVVLAAGLFDLVLPIVGLALVGIAVLALVLLLGAPGIGPGSAGGGLESNIGGGDEMPMANAAEAGITSGSPSDIATVVPATRLEYVMYFCGFGACAVVFLALLLG
ncbi:hypothetical protein [Halococcus hamelinensis]|uniref:Uncharacterized protein n=1 Tax=Halococcus hamelinensis 100A6 TaxID=1132509 RepID=M0LWU9_9EURY|nr:hypothetical protein [Halococcus hamelinensis]EMA36560.1 hypothetical protein C447_14921 [Halococcus hamelinensis 100A6]